jgi:hypothetical protein
MRQGLEHVARETGARLGRAFRYAFADPEWAGRYLIAGAILLIPVAGYLALLGWQRRVYEAVRRGERGLPAPELSRDINLGVPTFVNVVVLGGAALLVMALVVIPLRALGVRAGAYFPEPIVGPLFVALVLLVFPEILRRALAAGDKAALLRPGLSLGVVRRQGRAYGVTVLGMVVAYLVAALGANVCCLGLVLTAPVGHVLAAHLVAEWARDVER